MKKIRVKETIKLMRLPFLTLSIFSVLIGAGAVKFEGYSIEPLYLFLILLTVIFAHISNNVFNDYHDYLSGNDPQNDSALRPFSGGSGVLVEGKLTPAYAKKVAFLFLTLSALTGISVILLKNNPTLLILGIIGLFLVVSYTGLLKLGYKNLGEILVFISWGPLITGGTFYALTDRITRNALLISIVSGFMAMTVLLINEYADSTADKNVGKKTFINTIGRKAGSILISIVVFSAFSLYFILIFEKNSFLLYLPFLSFFVIFPAIFELWKRYKFENSIEFLPVVKKFIAGVNLFLLLVVISFLG